MKKTAAALLLALPPCAPAGGVWLPNHNQTVRGLRVKSNVKGVSSDDCVFGHLDQNPTLGGARP